METEIKEGPEPGGGPGVSLRNVGRRLETNALCWGKLRLRNKKGQIKAIWPQVAKPGPSSSQTSPSQVLGLERLTD